MSALSTPLSNPIEAIKNEPKATPTMIILGPSLATKLGYITLSS